MPVMPMLRIVAAFGLYTIVYLVGYPLVGATVTLAVVAPLAVSSLTYGKRGSLLGALVAQTLTAGLWWLSGAAVGDTVVRVGSGFGFLIVLGFAVALGHMRDLNRALARRAQAIEALGEAAQAVAGAVTRSDALQAILDAALRVVPARSALLSLSAEDDRALEVVATVGREDMLGVRVPVTDGIRGRAFRLGATQIVPDVRLDPDYMARVPETRSLIAVPIVSARRTYGVLNLTSDAVAAFGVREAQLLNAFAAHAAHAISAHRLLMQLRAGEARMRGVLDSAPLVIVATDRRGTCTYAGGSRLSAFWPDQSASLLGQPLASVFRVAQPRLAEAVSRALAGGTGEIAISEGDSVFALRYSPVFAEGAEGRVTGMVAVGIETGVGAGFSRV